MIVGEFFFKKERKGDKSMKRIFGWLETWEFKETKHLDECIFQSFMMRDCLLLCQVRQTNASDNENKHNKNGFLTNVLGIQNRLWKKCMNKWIQEFLLSHPSKYFKQISFLFEAWIFVIEREILFQCKYQELWLCNCK